MPVGPPQEGTGVIHIRRYARIGVGLLEMERLAQAQDCGIDLHRVDVLGAELEQQSHVIARARAQYQDAIDRSQQLERSQVVVPQVGDHGSDEQFGAFIKAETARPGAWP